MWVTWVVSVNGPLQKNNLIKSSEEINVLQCNLSCHHAKIAEHAWES